MHACCICVLECVRARVCVRVGVCVSVCDVRVYVCLRMYMRT